MTTGQKLREFGQLLLLNLVLMLLVSIPNLIFEELKLVDENSHAVTKMMQSMPFGLLIFLGGFFIPFLEELIFRLPLRYRRNYVLRGVSFLWVSINGKESNEKSAHFKPWWNSYYGVIFYFAAACFGLLHVTNFAESGWKFRLLVPFLIAPQFIAGLLLGFIRLRHGFYWGYLLHVANNCIFLIAPVFLLNHEVIVEESNPNYRLKIEKVSPYLPLQSSMRSTDSSLYAKVYSFENSVAMALSCPKRRVTIPDALSLEKKLNIEFEFSDDTDRNQVLLDALSKTYHFRVDSALKIADSYEIDVSDSTKLAQFRHPDSSKKGNRITTNFGQVSATNIMINQFGHYLGSKFSLEIDYPSTDSVRYDFTLPIDSFETTREVLLTKYGISFRESEQEVIYYQLVPESSD